MRKDQTAVHKDIYIYVYLKGQGHISSVAKQMLYIEQRWVYVVTERY